MKKRLGNGLTAAGIAALAVLLCAGTALAQNGPSVQGTITETESGALLPGAEVSLDGTPYRTRSGSDGRYRLDGVPAGDYTLVVSYVGFEDFETAVTVAAGETVSLAIELDARYEFDEEIVVQAVRFGQSKALNEQKEAVNIKNVLSEEQIQSFPDLNTAEVLQRVAGIGIQRDSGEGRFVSMRGTPSAMTNVTVNGHQVGYSNTENRMVELDVISAAQLSGIEVTKVLTPDMDAAFNRRLDQPEDAECLRPAGRRDELHAGRRRQLDRRRHALAFVVQLLDRGGRQPEPRVLDRHQLRPAPRPSATTTSSGGGAKTLSAASRSPTP